MAKGESKIAHFLSGLSEGMTKEEAMHKSGVSKATANTQHYKWKKEHENAEVEHNEEEID